jgi:hypothetical protein
MISCTNGSDRIWFSVMPPPGDSSPVANAIGQKTQERKATVSSRKDMTTCGAPTTCIALTREGRGVL